MRILFYIFLVLYVVYALNKFLTRFYFQKFSGSQNDLLKEMIKRQQQEFEKQRKRREGEVRIEQLNKKHTDNSNKNQGGDYIDYEVLK
ncbi:MAG TPA: hypothetical protein VL947_10770 [Cytophagales bacterium]|nr:hypothetical protein [Cytophagales bacterium]